MLRPSLFSVSLLTVAAVCCAGCELPHGPLRWDPLGSKLLPHGQLHAPGPFCLADSCEDDLATSACRDSAQAPVAGPPGGPRFAQHHQAVPLAGPGIDAPWPKFHPVPTRPVFEPHCLPPAEAAPPPFLQ